MCCGKTLRHAHVRGRLSNTGDDWHVLVFAVLRTVTKTLRMDAERDPIILFSCVFGGLGNSIKPCSCLRAVPSVDGSPIHMADLSYSPSALMIGPSALCCSNGGATLLGRWGAEGRERVDELRVQDQTCLPIKGLMTRFCAGLVSFVWSGSRAHNANTYCSKVCMLRYPAGGEH